MLKHFPTVIFEIAAWSSVAVLAGASLLPSTHVARTGIGHNLEHFVAYFLSAVIFCLAYPSLRQRAGILIGLTIAAALFEIGQHFSPGRVPTFANFAAGAAGVVSGVLLSLLVVWLRAAAASGRGV